MLVVAVSRNGETFVPDGNSTIEEGDLITLVGKRERLDGVQKKFRGVESRNRNIAIMGGSRIGSHLARLLDNGKYSVKLIERDMDRCNVLAAQLKHVRVICRDATTRSALEQEHMENVDLFISATRDDEQNIMANVLAKEVGASRSIAVIHQPDFAPLVYKLGIDHTVTPRASLANRILRIVHEGRASRLSVLEEGEIEIVEFAVRKPSAITGKKLSQIGGKLPRHTLIAAILRGENVIVPGGEDSIEVGDSVVVIVSLDSIGMVQKLFDV